MSVSRSNDLLAKYFDKTYYTPHFTDKKLLEFIEPIINKTLINQLKGESIVIVNLLKKKLTSIRSIKKFDKVFYRNMSKVRNDIYFPDVIVISLIEVTRFELFDFIRKYQNDLSVSPSDIDSISYFTVLSQFDKLKQKYEDIINQSNLDKEDKDLIFYLFPHIKTTIEFQPDSQFKNISSFRSSYNDNYESVEKNNRLAHFLLTSKFFTSGTIEDSIARITSQDYKDRIVSFLQTDKIILSEGVELLTALFPEGPYNKNLRRISLNWIREIITKHPIDIVKQNMLICLSFVAKILSNQETGFMGLSEKKSASFYTWDYLKNEGADKDILLKILSYKENSDTFADTILFYSIMPDRSIVKLNDEMVKKVATAYIYRIELKLNNAKSIYDSKIFDDINITIWRWHQALEYCAKNCIETNSKIDIKNHIVNKTIGNPANFELLLRYSFEDWGDEDISFKEDSISVVIGKDNFFKLIEDYLKNKKHIGLDQRRINVLSNWMNSYKKPE